MTPIVLQDPQSGELVSIAFLTLPQACRFCGLPMEGAWGVTTGGSSWSCLSHATRLIMSLDMSPEFLSRAKAREQLRGTPAGEKTIVTHELLETLGLES